MYCGAWVIAHKSGGPMESVVEGKTGNLLDNEEPEKWGQRMKEMIDNESLRFLVKSLSGFLQNIK